MSDPEDKVPNIYWIISVFPGTKNGYGNSDPGIKSWSQPVGVLNDLLENIFNIKG